MGRGSDAGQHKAGTRTARLRSLLVERAHAANQARDRNSLYLCMWRVGELESLLLIQVYFNPCDQRGFYLQG